MLVDEYMNHSFIQYFASPDKGEKVSEEGTDLPVHSTALGTTLVLPPSLPTLVHSNNVESFADKRWQIQGDVENK